MGKGKPLPGDRAAWDAKDYPLVHTNDLDTLGGIHHTLGTDATQAAPGNHTHDERYYTEGETDTLLDGKSDTTHTHSHFTDTANPHSVTKDQVGLGDVVNLKCNLAATAAPTVSDDSADGYAVGSSWFDVTNDKAYLCLDATEGAAIWQEVGAGGGAAINVQEVDGTPSVDNVTTIKVTNGSLTDNTGGVVTLDLGGGASSLHDLTDVDDTGKANGDRLVYNGTTTKWEPEAPVSNLDGLTDVVITTPATGQVLKYDGTNWKNDSDLVGTGGSDATAIHDDTAGEISLITEKTSLVDNDLFLIEDSAASYAKKRVKRSNIGANVVGPSSAVSGHLAVFDGTTGKVIKDGGAVYSGGIPGLATFTPPILSNFSWFNQGTAEVSEVNSGIHMYAPAVSGDQLRILEKNIPSSPYSITSAMLITAMNINYSQAGICLRDSTSGKIVACQVEATMPFRLAINKWNNATSYNSNYRTDDPRWETFVLWLRVTDDGTNRQFWYSNTGKYFIPLHSISRTDFVTPNKVGMWLSSSNSTYPMALAILSWKEE